MKAVILPAHGGVEALQYTDFPEPLPGPGEVLVRLQAAGINRLDVWVRNGWPGIKLEYPHIPGADGAGIVAALGEGVQGWSPGERAVINANLSCGKCEACLAGLDNQCRQWGLLGETRRGTYAQFVAVPAANLYRLPAGIDPHVAAAAGLVFHTAWHSLITRGKLSAGESVLIVGASGGVNTASIQIAKFAGASVYVIGSSPQKLALAESLGADVLIDRSQEPNWARKVYQLTGSRGVDIVVDNVGTTFPLSFRAARKGGRILTVGNTAGPLIEIDNRFLFAKHLTILGSTMGTHNDFATVMELVFAGKLQVALDQVFPLAEVRRAHARLESGEQQGKLTLEIPD